MARDIAPSAMTLGGLLLAFWSLTLTLDGRYVVAAWVLFAAAMADVFDGALARGLGSISPFGKQVDSLVDVLAAGVAPAFLVWRVYFEPWDGWGVVVAFAWVAFVVIRLARFNTEGLVEGYYFVGVPCPIAATVLTQYIVFSRATFGDDGSAWFVVAAIVVLGALMLSPVPYWRSSTLMPRAFFRYGYGPGALATAVLMIPFPRQALFVATLTSVAAAVLLHTLRGLAARTARPVAVGDAAG